MNTPNRKVTKMARQQKVEKPEITVLEEPRKSLFDRVAGFLDANDWRYHVVEDKKYFDLCVSLKHASARVIMDVEETDSWQRLMTYTVYPVYVPENRRSAVLDSINRINFATVFGNLEMDVNDGEIRVRTVVEADHDLTEPMMERVLHGNMNLASRYFPALMAVAFGGADPATVLELATPREDKVLQ